MKKAISVLLSILCVFMTLAPAFAAEGDAAVTETEEVTLYQVTFREPMAGFEGGYKFVKTVDGVIQYEEDPEGEYCFFEGRYMLPSNVLPEYRHEIPEERYSPVEWDVVNQVAEGETVSFKIVTSEKYNVLTAIVFINGTPARLNALDEYAVYIDRNTEIDLMERDEKTGQDVLLRNHYNVSLTSGDGYKLMTLKDEYYHVTYYGDSFDFRLRVLSGYSAAGIKVSVQRGAGPFSDLLEEEDSDMLAGVLGEAEPLQSYGVDEDGYRLYKIENITSDCKIIVDGVQEESNVGIMAMLKRIVRLILDFLGIKLDILDSFTAYYNVKIDAAEAPDGVTYQVIRSTTDDFTPSEFTVTTGDGVTVIVTKKDKNQTVNVTWTPGNEMGEYKTEWKPSFNHLTGETTYSAVFNIDNISADTEILIY